MLVIADGASSGSILVFASGTIAAVAAIAAAVITTRSADARQKTTLRHEREREQQRLDAERERIASQLAHERESVQHAEASKSIEKIVRSVSRVVRHASRSVENLIKGSGDTTDLEALRGHALELREEVAVLAIRPLQDASLPVALGKVGTALSEAIPDASELPLVEDKKTELRSKLKTLKQKEAEFWKAAREELAS